MQFQSPFELTFPTYCCILMRLRNRNISIISHFPTEFLYQNSYFSTGVKEHPSQRPGKVLKINIWSVCRISAESAKALACNQLSRSEYKLTRKCLSHSFYHAVLEKLVRSSRLLNTNYEVLLAYFNCVVLQFGYMSRLSLVLTRIQIKMREQICRFASCFIICQIIDRCSPNCLKKEGKIECWIHEFQVFFEDTCDAK